MAKPFSILELVARIRAILRRTKASEALGQVTCGPFRFDFAAMTATRDGRSLDLTAREMRILEILVTYPGRTHSRSDLLRLAWESDARPSPRTVDVHVANLRKKLGDETAHRLIATVGGEGYRWTERPCT
jgi:DNA-binding response OmpR family regulator